MSRMSRLFLVVAAAISLFPAVFCRAQSEDTVIVVPSRYTLVQLAFDAATIHPSRLISYDVPKGTSTLVLFAWDGNAWNRISIDDYRAGSIFPELPKRTILVGTDEGILKKLTAASATIPEIKMIKSMAVMDLVNGLDAVFGFSTTDWQWLANRHHLELKDLNVDVRRYGRYGKPGERAQRPEAKLESKTDVVKPVPAVDKSLDLPPMEPAAVTTPLKTTPVKTAPENK